MTTFTTQLVVSPAPRLPSARAEYDITQQNALNKALQDYFGRIDGVQSSLLGPAGARFLDAPYAIFICTANQTSASTTAVNSVTFTTMSAGTGLSLVSNSHLTVLFPGLFDFTFLIQLNNTGAGPFDQYFWLRQNGVDVPNSAHRYTCQIGSQRINLDFPIQLAQNDYVELMWNTASTAVILQNTAAQTSPVAIPAIPSVYANVQFTTASNSSSVDSFIPPAPPAPAPVPPPPPGPAPGPPPTPAPAVVVPGQDTDVAAIFSGGATGAWWYPAYDADRAFHPDGSGGSPTADNTPFQYLKDHNTATYNIVYPTSTDCATYYSSLGVKSMGIWTPASEAGLGGSTTGFCACFALRFDGGYYNTVFSDVSGAAATATNGVYLRFHGPDGKLHLSAGNSSTRVEVSDNIIEGSGPPTYIVLTWYDNTAHTLNMRVNDNTVVSVACSALSAGSTAMRLFSNPINDTSLGGNGVDKFYGVFYGGVVIKNSSLTSAQRETLRYWCAAKAGVTLAGSGGTSTSSPPPPAPAPPPVVASPPPSIANLSRHPKDLLQIGNYFIQDARAGAVAAGIPEGTASYQFQQQVERYTATGPNGEIAFEFKWYMPQYNSSGVAYDNVTHKIKNHPSAIYGAKPGYGSTSQWPQLNFEVRAADGVTVASAPPGTPSSIAADWTPVGGSVVSTSPSGSSGGVLPLLVPLPSLKATFRWNHVSAPTGVGHLTFDIWLQEQSAQTADDFPRAPVTHEITVDICNWGGYGGTDASTWARASSDKFADVTINNVLYHVYAWQNRSDNPSPPGGLVSGTTFPGVQYNYNSGSLSGPWTNEETGLARIGWKFIAFTPDLPIAQDATGLVTVDIAGIVNYLQTVNDSRGIALVKGTRYCVSAELCVETVYGQGDLEVWDYKISGTAASAPPPPPPPPAPAPAPGSAPFYPFGSRIDNNATTGWYNYGIHPTNFTKAQMDARLITAYLAWKNARLKSAPTFVASSSAVSGLANVTITDGLFDDFGDPLAVAQQYNRPQFGYVSEGMGYALLILVIMAGYDANAQNQFDRVFKVCRARPAYASSPVFMEWRVNMDMSSAGGGYAAYDGDMDMCLALYMADRQWGSTGTFNYRAEANAMVAAMKTSLFSAAKTLTDSYHNVSRTSDYMPNHFRVFGAKTSDATFWDAVRTRCAVLISSINSGYSSTAHLQPGFIYDPDSTVGAPNTGPRPDTYVHIDGSQIEQYYDYNACRNPWRWGTDFLLTGDSTWGTFASQNATTIKNDSNGDPLQTANYYHLDGVPVMGRFLNAAFCGPAMLGGMCNATHQAYVNAAFLAMTDNYPTGYFGAELALLTLIVASGNWWKP